MQEPSANREPSANKEPSASREPSANSRIVTLLPSATEIVCNLGLRDRLVGVTHECDYPAGVESLPHVTRSAIDHSLSSLEIDTAVRQHLTSSNALYHLDEDLLRELRPDLIVTQALCEVCAVSEEEVLQVLNRLPGKPHLINLEPMTLTEVFETIDMVGDAAGCSNTARTYRSQLEERVKCIREKTESLADNDKPTVGFLEWIDPPFNAGHWTPEIIEYAGGIDSFGNKHQPSRTISIETIEKANPDVLIIALCGFTEPRAREDLDILKQRLDYKSLKAFRENRVHVMDGNALFSRPGPRLVDSLEALFELLHPTLS